MASSPCSPAGRNTLALTSNCMTPGASVLRTQARRVVQHSVAKDLAASARPLQTALDHASMFDKVTILENENMELKSRVRDLTEQLGAAMERATAAEAAAAAGAAAAGAADCGAACGQAVAGAVGGGSLSQAEMLARLSAMALAQPALAEQVAMVRRSLEQEQELLTCQAARRRAHDQLVESRGAVRVVCRVRPAPGALAVRPLADGATVAVACAGQEASFAFSRVFAAASTAAQVFGEVEDLVQSSMDGYNVCLMSHGQTGSGKTHSMLGGGQPEDKGIIPRAIDKIIGQQQRLAAQGWSYSLDVSCMELYGNGLRDLLAEETTAREANITDINAIKHDSQGVTTVVGISRHSISSTPQALSLLARATAARAVGSTACNAQSSRSHCVFWMHIKGTHASDSTQLQGALCLVDLAGSERLERSQAQGVQKNEAAAINTSLSALGDVFEALASKRQHVPYRNSKLTYLLKPCLSQGGKTLFLVHINPDAPSAHESLTSLRFATKVAGTELGQATRKVTSQGLSIATQPQQQTTPIVAPAPQSTTTTSGVFNAPVLARRPQGTLVAEPSACFRRPANVTAVPGRAAIASGRGVISAAATAPRPVLSAPHIAAPTANNWQMPEGGADSAALLTSQEPVVMTGSSCHGRDGSAEAQAALGGPVRGSLTDICAVEEEEEIEQEEEVTDLRAALRRKRQAPLGGPGPASKRPKGAWH